MGCRIWFLELSFSSYQRGTFCSSGIRIYNHVPTYRFRYKTILGYTGSSMPCSKPLAIGKPTTFRVTLSGYLQRQVPGVTWCWHRNRTIIISDNLRTGCPSTQTKQSWRFSIQSTFIREDSFPDMWPLTNDITDIRKPIANDYFVEEDLLTQTEQDCLNGEGRYTFIDGKRRLSPGKFQNIVLKWWALRLISSLK